MNYARLILCSIAGTVAFYVYGFLVNGMLIAKLYQPFSGIYRSADVILGYMPLGLVGTLIAVLALSIIYTKGYEGGSAMAEGFRFGVLIGLFAVCTHAVDNFVTFRIGRRLSLELAAASFVQWVLVCLLIALIHRPAKKAEG